MDVLRFQDGSSPRAAKELAGAGSKVGKTSPPKGKGKKQKYKVSAVSPFGIWYCLCHWH